MFAVSRATVSGSMCSPISTTAALPGMMRSMIKISSTTPSSTGIVPASRLRKLFIGFVSPLPKQQKSSRGIKRAAGGGLYQASVTPLNMKSLYPAQCGV